MEIRPVVSDTGTVHIVNRYEVPQGEPMIAVTRCSRTFEVDETSDYEDVDEDDICGRCA